MKKQVIFSKTDSWEEEIRNNNTVIFGLEENRNETYGDIGSGEKVFDRNNVLKNLVITTDQVIRLGKKEANDIFWQNSHRLPES